MKLYDFMQFLFRAWMLLGLVAAMACEYNYPEGHEPTVIETQPDDQADAGTSNTHREYAEVEVCSVAIRLVFQNGEGVEAQFDNGNDATVIVEITNTTTGGLVVKNCLWPDGQDREAAHFHKGERLTIEVYLGEGDLLQYTCSELVGDAFGSFNFCDDMDVSIQ
ncbi:MAG: hypothetical protein PHD72_04385 [Patescibacteria group bacterium]|nr:hypothetical protein [Patescibacteria group bacterium]